MRKLVALRKLRYPRNVHGKEYKAGDEFEALSDRDVKALTLARIAREVGQYEHRSLQAQQPVSQRAPEPTTVVTATPEPERASTRYSRRDMRASED